MNKLFNYDSSKIYDELISSKSYRKSNSDLGKFIDGLDIADLKEINEAKDDSVNSLGISFETYKEKNLYLDRTWPLDFIPRIIEKKEWDHVSKGLVQRTNALNLFIEDCYNEQSFFKEGLMDPKLILNSPAFKKECLGMKLKFSSWAHICGSDLIRNDDGNFYVLEDNLRVPSGVSYMIENRMVMKRVLPDLFNSYGVMPVDEYPSKLYKMLSSLSDNTKNPEIVLLTPGVYNSAYFEHSYLARQVGIELVQGSDLEIGKNGYVYKKTIYGLKKIDVIYRRMNEEFLDPIAWNKESLIGVPGLIDSWKKNKVTIVNAPGSGIADDKAVYAFVPKMIEFFLNEKPILKNVKTYLCSIKNERDYVIDNIEKLVVKPVSESGGHGIVIGKKASKLEIKKLKNKIFKNPRNFVAQPLLNLSTSPTYISGKIVPRHLDLRPFILSGQKNYVTVGGLTRVALKKGSYIVNSSQGGGSKDTWVVNNVK